MGATGSARTCANGHTFSKTTDCPTCPICEAQRRPAHGFMSAISAPARRALEREGLTTLTKLAGLTEAEVLALHGIGPASLPPLRSALRAAGLRFRT